MRILSLIMGLIMIGSCIPSTFAEEQTGTDDEKDEYRVFIDEMDDFSKMSSHSDGFVILDADRDGKDADDKALIMGNASDGAEIVYELPFVIGSYTVYMYGSADNSCKISFYYSEDGKTYTKDKYTEHRKWEDGRVYTDPEVLKNRRFLKIVFESKTAEDNPYITKIEICEEPFVYMTGTRIKNTEVSTFDYKSLPSLKEAYKDYFTIGAAIEWFDVEHYPDLLTTQFNNMCSENQSRFQGLQPTEGNFNYPWAERLFDFGYNNGMDVRLHALMYYINTPSWVFVQPGGGEVTEEVMLKRYERHIKNVVSHFKGKVKYYDVVNEIIDAGVYRPYMNEMKVLGGDTDKFEDFIASCFKWAHEADPDARLLYLDNNNQNKEKRELAWHGTVQRILEKGVPRDRLILGEQGHWGYNTAIHTEDGENSIEEMLIDARELGFPVAITELDLGLSNAAVAQDLKGETTNLDREAREELQAKKYASIFDLFREYSDIIELVTFWNVTDNTSWRGQTTGSHALLFDYNNEPYPAFYRLFDFEQKEPRWTKEDIIPVVYPNGYSPREIQAAYGTPIVDGKLDSVWKTTEEAAIDRQTDGEKGAGATGNFRCLWDEKNFYVFAEIKDNNLNCDNDITYYKDNIEVYLDEQNSKGGAFSGGVNQLRYTIDGIKAGKGFGAWTIDCFDAAVVKTADGYDMEFVYHMGLKENQADDILGFDIQITDHIDDSTVRRCIKKFCDNIGETHNNPSNWGTAKCVYKYVPDLSENGLEIISDGKKVSMEIGGKKVIFAAENTDDGTILVSAKSLLEFLGGYVRCTDDMSGIRLIYDRSTLELKSGKNEFFINGNYFEADTGAEIINGKTYVPVEAVLKCFGIDYEILEQ